MPGTGEEQPSSWDLSKAIMAEYKARMGRTGGPEEETAVKKRE